jgi:hypothetical protein
MEESALHDMGVGLDETSQEKRSLLAQRVSKPVASFYCPSRRAATAYPFTFAYPFNTERVKSTGKCDYCVNVGDRGGHTDNGPVSLARGDAPEFQNIQRENTGIAYQLSTVTLRQIVDGTGKTYMVCERNLDPDFYTTGTGPDDDGLYVGFDNDTCREAYHPPLPDTPGVRLEDRFGSAHSTVWQAAMCDGSVWALSYSVDVAMHRRLGNREDGEVADVSSL